jgi:hypothetical protein
VDICPKFLHVATRSAKFYTSETQEESVAGRIFMMAAVISIIARSAAAQGLPKIVAPSVEAQPHGRYQIVTSPFTERNIFLLDTESGAVWQLEVLNTLTGEPLVWNLMPRIDSDDDMARLVARLGKKPATKAAPQPVLRP